MPCTSVFDRQDAAWRESVLPRGLPRVAVEAGVTDYWRKYVGLEGEVVGIDRFGESAPAPEVYKFLGIDAAHRGRGRAGALSDLDATADGRAARAPRMPKPSRACSARAGARATRASFRST